jgi:hypothetical protein
MASGCACEPGLMGGGGVCCVSTELGPEPAASLAEVGWNGGPCVWGGGLEEIGATRQGGGCGGGERRRAECGGGSEEVRCHLPDSDPRSTVNAREILVAGYFAEPWVFSSSDQFRVTWITGGSFSHGAFSIIKNAHRAGVS